MQGKLWVITEDDLTGEVEEGFVVGDVQISKTKAVVRLKDELLMNIIYTSGECITFKYDESIYNKITENNRLKDRLDELKDRLELAELENIYNRLITIDKLTKLN